MFVTILQHFTVAKSKPICDAHGNLLIYYCCRRIKFIVLLFNCSNFCFLFIYTVSFSCTSFMGRQNRVDGGLGFCYITIYLSTGTDKRQNNLNNLIPTNCLITLFTASVTTPIENLCHTTYPLEITWFRICSCTLRMRMTARIVCSRKSCNFISAGESVTDIADFTG
jgi:hypothetical protein